MAEWRITPAHAGKTTCAWTVPISIADHPRACGENLKALRVLKEKVGSPPRMRGKLAQELRLIGTGRITPAHAGKTPRACASAPRRADHPRACGENGYIINQQRLRHGSPPRMRGKPFHGSCRHRFSRITPAHAGKTCVKEFCTRNWTDHPRACGENTVKLYKGKGINGSPPRMRGKRRFD